MSENSASPPTSPVAEKTLAEALWQPMFAFEAGQLTMSQVIAWFTQLIETGYIWNMPSTYLDNATELIDAGYIGNPDREVN